MSCDVGEVTERLENELCFAHSPTFPSLPTSQLILQPFRRFTYITTHSPTIPLLHLHHSSFSNSSVASTTSQLILPLFRCFTYVTAHSPALLSLLLRHRFSLTSPGEPPMVGLHWNTHYSPSLFLDYLFSAGPTMWTSCVGKLPLCLPYRIHQHKHTFWLGVPHKLRNIDQVCNRSVCVCFRSRWLGRTSAEQGGLQALPHRVLQARGQLSVPPPGRERTYVLKDCDKCIYCCTKNVNMCK